MGPAIRLWLLSREDCGVYGGAFQGFRWACWENSWVWGAGGIEKTPAAESAIVGCLPIGMSLFGGLRAGVGGNAILDFIACCFNQITTIFRRAKSH